MACPKQYRSILAIDPMALRPYPSYAVLTVSVDLVCDAHEIDLHGEMMVGGVANLHWKRFQSRSGLDFVEDREISPAHTTHENSCHENFFTDMCVHGRAKQSRIYIYIMP